MPACLPPTSPATAPTAVAPAPAPQGSRLAALDGLRGLSMLGMVLVNFRLAMGVDAPAGAWLAPLFQALEGRTAALFVTLAGMGLVMGASRQTVGLARSQALRRAFWLAVIGLLNLLIFPADILHYYACYFALGAWFLGGSARLCLSLALLLPFLYLGALFCWPYDRGWDWQTLNYIDLWQPQGFVRHLVFNGFHPVLPWMAFFFWGMGLARLPLQQRSLQKRLLLGGAAVFLACLGARELAALYLPSWAALLGTAPLPPGPLYLFSAGALATALVGAALLALPDWAALRALGRCTLTVYLAHILLGMGALEAAGMLSGRSLGEVLAAGLGFGALALLASWLWLRHFPQGPVEMLMRRLIGKPAQFSRLQAGAKP